MTKLQFESPQPLTAAQLSTLRERLLSEREKLRGIGESMAVVREPCERSAEEMDQAGASLVQHEALVRVAHDRHRLARVERALQKMEAGTYGICEISEEPIGYARLSAMPWARFTAAEQELAERKARQFA